MGRQQIPCLLTAGHSDRRDLLGLAGQGDEQARLALEIECYRLKKYIGAYLAALAKVDAVVFTAGVGENSPFHLAKICEGLEAAGISLDPLRNMATVGSKREADQQPGCQM